MNMAATAAPRQASLNLNAALMIGFSVVWLLETRQSVILAEEAVRLYSELLDPAKIQRAAGSATDLSIAKPAAVWSSC